MNQGKDMTQQEKETLEALILACDVGRVTAHLGVSFAATEDRIRNLVDYLEPRQKDRCEKHIKG